MSFPRVIALHVGDLRPIVTGHALIREAGPTFDGTALLSCKFFMQNLADDTMKINGVAGTIDTANPLVMSYTWVGTDTDTAGRFASWFLGYFGAASTIPQTFVGPEIRIFTAGARLVY